MYLLDTNVLSELRRARPHGAVVAWVESVPDARLQLSAVTLTELQAGIEKLRARDAVRAREIEAWADQVEETFAVLPIDSRVFRLHARWMHERAESAYEDALIAATAHVHGLTVATRNTEDFAAYDVAVFNPFGFAGRS